MKNLKSLTLKVSVGVLCFSAGKFLTTPKVEIKEVEKIVYKESSRTQTETNRVVDKKETIKPDGTRIIETSSSTQRTTDKKSDKSLDREAQKDLKSEARPDWRVTLTYVPVMFGNSAQSYGLDIQRRIISEIYLGVNVNTEKTIGFSIGIGF